MRTAAATSRFIAVRIAAGIFEGNVVHYEPDQLEMIATKFSTECVGTLLDGGSSSYHGAMTTDWALKGAESSTLQELIRCANGRVGLQAEVDL
jgi:hypothetical protein